MPTKFNIFSRGGTLKTGVELISTHRKLAKPVDLRVESSHVTYLNGTLEIDGSKFDVSGAGFVPLCLYLGVDRKLIGRLSKPLADAVIIHLLSQREGKMFIRTAADGDTNYVRTVLKSKFNVMDDRVLFGKLLDRARMHEWENTEICGTWVSDVGSAIRVKVAELPETSEKFGLKVSYGFDVANSELFPQAAWVKGVLMFDDVTIVCPKILGARNTSDLTELLSWVDALMHNPITVWDTLAFSGMPTGDAVISRELSSLGAKRLITKAQQDKIRELLPAGDECTYVDLMRAVGEFAATVDYYHKRSSLEYISNMWCRSIRRK